MKLHPTSTEKNVAETLTTQADQHSSGGLSPAATANQSLPFSAPAGNATAFHAAHEMTGGPPVDEALEHKNYFATAMGFDSYAQLTSASEIVASNDGLVWRLTALPNNTWAAWNETQLHLERHYASRQEALENVPHDSCFTGSCLLG